MAKELEQYGETAKEFFRMLSSDIQEEFSAALQDIFKSEMANFQAQFQRAFSGYGNGLEDMIGHLLPADLLRENNIAGAAFRGVLRSALSDYFRTGSVNARHVITSASRSGSAVFGRQMLPLSRSQQSAESFTALEYGRRNI